MIVILDSYSVLGDTSTLYLYQYTCAEYFCLRLITYLEAFSLDMTFQIQIKPQRKSISNYNCPKCGYKYKSLESYSSNLDANIIQIIECQHRNYSWRESWELPMWQSYRRWTQM